MAEFLPEPRDRLDSPICNAIEAKNYKQALKLVDKRLVKTKDSYLMALKCYIQACHPQVTEQNAAFARVLALAKPDSKEPQCDINDLELYDEAMRVLFIRDGSSAGECICKIRLLAVKSKPKDEKLAIACFRACLRRSNWEHAQQIANLLERNFASNRTYQFWCISIRAIHGSILGADDQKGRVLVRLAATQMKKLAEAAIEVAEKKGVAVSKSLQMPQELLLLHRLLDMSDDKTQRLDLYRNSHTGPTSKLAKGEWTFWRDYVILLKSQGKWPELLDVCNELLSRAALVGEDADPRGSDWVVWQAFTDAVQELPDSKPAEMLRAQFAKHMSPESTVTKVYRRNAALASLKYSFSRASFTKTYEILTVYGDTIKETSPKIIALGDFLRVYGQLPSAFEDVKPFVEMLSYNERVQLLQVLDIYLVKRAPVTIQEMVDGHVSQTQHLNFPPISTSEEIAASVNYSKFQYLLLSESGQAASNADGECLHIICSLCQEPVKEILSCNGCQRKLVIEVIKKYGWAMNDDTESKIHLLPTDKHPADDWAIVAAMGLLKLEWNQSMFSGGDKETHRFWLQAVVLLEFAHSKSKANSQILLLLIRLYTVLGAGSLALRAYKKLGLKQIQTETLSYLMSDRISSMHPHPVEDYDSNGNKDVLDPCERLENIQKMSRNFKNQIATNSWKAFECGSYDTVFQLLEVSNRINQSLNIASAVIELRRIKRITDPKAVMGWDNYGYDLLRPNPCCHAYVDNSDLKSFPNYEDSLSPPFEQYIRGPGPSGVSASSKSATNMPMNNYRIRNLLLNDQLWILRYSLSGSPADINAAISNIMASVAPLTELDGTNEFCTPSEVSLIKTGHNTAKFVIHACDMTRIPGEDYDALVSKAAGSIVAQVLNMMQTQVIQTCDIQQKKWIPDFTNTLHPLYTVYEAAGLVDSVMDFIISPLVSTSKAAKDQAKYLKIEMQKIRAQAAVTSAEVRKRMSDGGWMDLVLEEIQDDLPASVREADSQVHDGGQSPEDLWTPGHAITEAVGQDFLEWFAGELVNSWKESVCGLACLKSN